MWNFWLYYIVRVNVREVYSKPGAPPTMQAAITVKEMGALTRIRRAVGLDSSSALEGDRYLPDTLEAADGTATACDSPVIIGASIPQQGQKWREYIRPLRLQAQFQTAVSGSFVDPAVLARNPLHTMLSKGCRSREASFRLFISSAAVNKIMPLRLWRPSKTLSPPSSYSPTMHVTLSAPPLCSQLDIVDALITLGEDFRAQYFLSLELQQGPDLSALDMASCLFWLAAHIAREEYEEHCSLKRYCNALHDFALVCILQFVQSNDPDQMRAALEALRSGMEEAEALGKRRLRDAPLRIFLGAIQASVPVESLLDDIWDAMIWCDEHLLPHLPESLELLDTLKDIYAIRRASGDEYSTLHAIITISATALSRCPLDNPGRPRRIFMHVAYLIDRYGWEGGFQDLEVASRSCQDLLDLETQGKAHDVERHEILGMYDLIKENLKLHATGNESNLSVAEAIETSADGVQELKRLQQEIADELKRLPPLFAQFALARTAPVNLRIALLFKRCFAISGDTSDIAQATGFFAFVMVHWGPMRARQFPDRQPSTHDTPETSAQHLHFEKLQPIALSELAQLFGNSRNPLYDVRAAVGCIKYLQDELNPEVGLMKWMKLLEPCLRQLAEDPQCRRDLEMRPRLKSALAQFGLNAVNLLSSVASLGLDISETLEALHSLQGFAFLVSLICKWADRCADAVYALEGGRALFWAHTLKLRPINENNTSPSLRRQLADLSARLEQSRYLKHALTDSPSSTADYAKRCLLGKQYEDLLKKVQRQEDQSPRTITIDELLSSGRDGSVIILESYKDACGAYVLAKDEPIAIPFGPNVTPSILRRYLTHFEKTIAHARSELVQATHDAGEERIFLSADGQPTLATPPGESAESRAYRRSLPKSFDVLKFLWTAVVKPVLDALELKPAQGRARPRLWWCCTAEFAFLPVHAAGDYGVGGECCSDYVVSSYTPTVTALLNARKAHQKVARKDAKVLLGAVPLPYSGSPLPGTVAELQHISAFVPREQLIALPPSDDAQLGSPAGLTMQTTIEKLPEASILHLACHGTQDYTNALNSGFIMRDQKLTILSSLHLCKHFQHINL